jgi:hypothetical protein
MDIGISELQKNISMFKNLKETVQIIDKKSKEVLALVLPKSQIESTTLTDAIGGILQTNEKIREFRTPDEMKQVAYDEEMRAKYGS